MTQAEAQEPNGQRQHRSAGLFVWVTTLWLGVLIGVSFLATPVKFQAPSLDLPTALDVGRVTFDLLIKAEWGLWLALTVAAVLARVGRLRWAGQVLLGLCLLAQTAWLLPVLDARVFQIIAGVAVPSSSHHLIYVLLEGLKALTLLALSLAGAGDPNIEGAPR